MRGCPASTASAGSKRVTNGDLYRIDAQGWVTTWSSGLPGPFVLNIDASGNAWVGADQGTDVLRFATATPGG